MKSSLSNLFFSNPPSCLLASLIITARTIKAALGKDEYCRVDKPTLMLMYFKQLKCHSCEIRVHTVRCFLHSVLSRSVADQKDAVSLNETFWDIITEVTWILRPYKTHHTSPLRPDRGGGGMQGWCVPDRWVPDKKFLDVAPLEQSVPWIFCPWPMCPDPGPRQEWNLLRQPRGLEGKIVKGQFVQGMQHPRIFGRGHSGRGRTNIAPCWERSGRDCKGWRQAGILDEVHMWGCRYYPPSACCPGLGLLIGKGWFVLGS